MRAVVSILAAAALVVACSSSDDRGGEAPVPCVADEAEPNDTAATATRLGDIQDDDEISIGSPAPESKGSRIDRTFSTHDDGDVDWYVVEVFDTGISGNPSLRVIVGDGHEATAFWSCTSGTTKAVVCGLGTPVTDDPDMTGRGCRSAVGSASPQLTMQIECDGTSTDNGRLYIRVVKSARTATCVRYRLIVTAE